MSAVSRAESFVTQLLDPAAVRARVPVAARPDAPDIWLHRYEHPETGWLLSVATHAAPGSHKLSLGGFRIAPESRTSLPDYDNDAEAVGLAVGMEEKVYWSRVLRVGGPLASGQLDHIVGGKCVLRPTPAARVGQPNDRALLDFAVQCLEDVNATHDIQVTTGQDLGHGVMHDGATTSLEYLHARFAGSVLADTSKPTAEGNFHLLRGMLAGADIALGDARVLLVGAGNIGRHLLGRLRAAGATVGVVEAVEAARATAAASGASEVVGAEERVAAMGGAWDAVVVNAAGGSLDAGAVEVIARNGAVRVVCGSENLAMPDPTGERVLLTAGKVYAHTELGGMMGYLTAAEEYLARRAGMAFDVGTLFAAAERLYDVGEAATRRVARGGYGESFQEAARAVANPR